MINTQCSNELEYTNVAITTAEDHSYESTEQNSKSKNLISNKNNGL